MARARAANCGKIPTFYSASRAAPSNIFQVLVAPISCAPRSARTRLARPTILVGPRVFDVIFQARNRLRIYARRCLARAAEMSSARHVKRAQSGAQMAGADRARRHFGAARRRRFCVGRRCKSAAPVGRWRNLKRAIEVPNAASATATAARIGVAKNAREKFSLDESTHCIFRCAAFGAA
jgi:hypothetical protein